MASWPTGLATTWAPSMALAYTRMQDFSDAAYYLYNSRPNDVKLRDNNATYTTTSTSFVDIDGTNLAITLTITSGKVLIGFSCTVAGTGIAMVDISVDGTRIGSSGSGLASASSSFASSIGFTVLKTGLTNASHVFKPQWRSDAGSSVSLYSGNGSTYQDMIPAFWVVEVG